MAKTNIELKGVVIDTLPSDTFKIDIGDGNIVTAYISGKIRKNHIRILIGDQVTVEVSPYDTTMGRITFRNRV